MSPPDAATLATVSYSFAKSSSAQPTAPANRQRLIANR